MFGNCTVEASDLITTPQGSAKNKHKNALTNQVTLFFFFFFTRCFLKYHDLKAMSEE